MTHFSLKFFKKKGGKPHFIGSPVTKCKVFATHFATLFCIMRKSKSKKGVEMCVIEEISSISGYAYLSKLSIN